MSNRRKRIEELRKRTEERKLQKSTNSISTLKSHSVPTLAHKGAHKSNNARYSIPCINEGAILEYCHKCNGELKHVRECDIFEKCTRGEVSLKVHACITCTEYKAIS